VENDYLYEPLSIVEQYPRTTTYKSHALTFAEFDSIYVQPLII